MALWLMERLIALSSLFRPVLGTYPCAWRKDGLAILGTPPFLRSCLSFPAVGHGEGFRALHLRVGQLLAGPKWVWASGELPSSSALPSAEQLELVCSGTAAAVPGSISTSGPGAGKWTGPWPALTWALNIPKWSL